MQKHISSNSRSSGSDPTRRNSARRASISSRFAAYSERRTRRSRYLGTARKARTRHKSIWHRTRSGLTRRLNNGFRYEATMSLLYSLARALDRFSPAPVAYAHCDIPCGIYDPHHAQMAAHTVVRMIDLINQLEKPGPNATPEQRQEYNAKLARYVFVKEQHAEIAKSEVHPVGRLLQTGSPEDVPGPARPRLEGAQVGLEGTTRDQPASRRGSPQGDQRHRLDLLEDEGPRDDHRQGAVSDGTPDRLPEVPVGAARGPRRCSPFADSGSRTRACDRPWSRGTTSW